MKYKGNPFIILEYQNKGFMLLHISPFDEVRNAAKAQLHAALKRHFNYKSLFYIYTYNKSSERFLKKLRKKIDIRLFYVYIRNVTVSFSWKGVI